MSEPRLPALTFRFAELNDVPALGALVQSAYRGADSRQGWTTEAHLVDGQRTDAEELTAVIGRSSNGILLAEVGEELIGCCQLESRGDGTAYLGLFSVRPLRQGQGIGRAVLGEAERIAREEWSARQMQMTVISRRDELIAWYERLGYRRTGETLPFPYGNARFGTPKVLDLEFAVLAKALR
jgi:ribosomal protein S18 acetylase RimI-like enzyme